MTTTTTLTTTPACPGWCSGEHTSDPLGEYGMRTWVGQDGNGLPDGTRRAICRDHITTVQDPVALERTDVLLDDGTWLVGQTVVSFGEVSPTERLSTSDARDLAVRILELTDVTSESEDHRDDSPDAYASRLRNASESLERVMAEGRVRFGL